MYLLDTKVISEVRKGRRCDQRVAAWYADISEPDLFLSVLITGHRHRGLAGLGRRQVRNASSPAGR